MPACFIQGDTGGITGYNNAGCTITACYASGIIHGLSDTTPTYVGGVAGLNSGTITASYLADGDVAGYDRVGGVIGEQTGGTASACCWSISTGAANPPQYGIGGVNGTDKNAVKVTDAKTGEVIPAQLSAHPRGVLVSFLAEFGPMEEKEFFYEEQPSPEATLYTRTAWVGAERVRDIVNTYDPESYRLPYGMENRWFSIRWKIAL